MLSLYFYYQLRFVIISNELYSIKNQHLILFNIFIVGLQSCEVLGY